MRIRKIEESILPEGHVINSLEVGSSTNAPSIDAVNNALNGVVLYENSEGTAGDITLSDNVTNYKIMEIYWSGTTYDAQIYYTIGKFFIKGDNTRTLLSLDRIDSQGLFTDVLNLLLTEKTINVTRARCYRTHYDDVTDITDYKIYKVIGYK